jgi:hypothetical protein
MAMEERVEELLEPRHERGIEHAERDDADD